MQKCATFTWVIRVKPIQKKERKGKRKRERESAHEMKSTHKSIHLPHNYTAAAIPDNSMSNARFEQ